MSKRPRRLVAVGVIVALCTAVAVTAAFAASSSPSQVKAGGTVNVGWEQSFGFNDSFDPTGEYLGDAWGIYTNLLLRTLVGYNHVAGVAGNQLVPDLATSVPKPTNGGKTYTFHLRPGVKFGPPVEPCGDVEGHRLRPRARRESEGRCAVRLLLHGDQGLYRLRHREPRRSPASQTPNASTIVFNLTQPAGDFLYRLAMPATAPLPVEVGEVLRAASRASTAVTSSRPART